MLPKIKTGETDVTSLIIPTGIDVDPAPAVTAGFEKAAETMKQSAAAATANFEKTVEGVKHTVATATVNLEKAQVQMKEGVQRAMKTSEQFVHFGQGNVEAVVKSSQILATGLQDLTKHIAANAKLSMEETVSTFKALSGVKSLKEAYELQTSFAKAAMEKAVAESGKITETSLKLVEEAYAPISARMNVAVETFAHRA